MRTEPSGSARPARYFHPAACSISERFVLNTSSLSLFSPWKSSCIASLLISHRTRVFPSCPQNTTTSRSLFRRRKSQIMWFTHIYPLGKQPRHPARSKRRREDETQRRARTLRDEYPTVGQCRDNAARLAVAGSHNACGIPARQLSPVEDRFEDAARFGRQRVEPDFFLCPQKDACTQAFRLHQAFHKFHLVDAGSEKEVCESREGLLAQITAPVEIVATGPVT